MSRVILRSSAGILRNSSGILTVDWDLWPSTFTVINSSFTLVVSKTTTLVYFGSNPRSVYLVLSHDGTKLLWTCYRPGPFLTFSFTMDAPADLSPIGTYTYVSGNNWSPFSVSA
jgi:hypothetical protein